MVHAAYLHRQLGETKKAMKLVENAIEQKKDYPQFYALQASLFDEQKKYNDAEKVLLKAADLFPENEQLIFFLGSTQDKLGKRQDTIANMKKVLKLNQDHVQAMNYLAYTYAELGTELTDAEQLARKALKIKPNDAYIKDTLGWILYKQGKLKEAVLTLENAHQMNPEESVIAEHLGDAYYQYQLFTKAKDMYERAARVEKNEDNVKKLETKIDHLKKMLTDTYKRVPASY
jgi:Tfp pilus assembly protein PilF